MPNLLTRIDEAAAVIRAKWPLRPVAGIVLGSGLSNLAASVNCEASFENSCIPHLPTATALGHQGRFLCGQLAGVPVIVQQGRLHAYEGHSFEDVTFPVRVMQALGIEVLVLTNAAGAVNPDYECGDIMLLEDHINLMWGNPLTGVHDDRLGARFPDMSQPYDAKLLEQAEQIGRSLTTRIQRGVYVAMSGPSYETSAEYRMIQRLGGDVVGMSTVPEVLVARQAGLRVLAMSVVSNVFRPHSSAPTTGHAVVETVAAVEPILQQIVTGVLRQQ